MAGRKPYRILRKDGNVGVEASARTIKKVYEYAALGMCSYLWDTASVHDRSTISLEIRSHDATSLFYKFLKAILHMHQTQKLLLKKISVPEMSEKHLRAELKGEMFDPKRHEILKEIADLRQHGMEIKKRPQGWMARVHFDV